MSDQTRKKLLQFSLWFDHHRRSITDADQAMKFALKAMDEQMDIFAHLVRDVQDLERRNTTQTAVTDAGIWLPRHLRHDEAVTAMREDKPEAADLVD